MIEIGFIFGMAIYMIVWFLTLFMVLPFGVRTQEEAGKVEEGSVASAPAIPQMWRKIALTTLISLILYIGVYWLLTSAEAQAFWSMLVPDFARPEASGDL